MPGQLTSDFLPRDMRMRLRNETVWEWITGNEAPDEDAFSAMEASALLQGYLYDHRALRDTLATFIGFSYVKNQQHYRRLPMQHPRWPWLRCDKVTIKGVKFDGKEEPIVGGGMAALQHNPKYQKYRFLIEYRNLPFDCRTDETVTADGSGEWGRFIELDPVDDSEILTQDGGSYEYDAPGKPWDDQSFAGPTLKVRVERTDLIVTAHGIAADFILNASGIPTNFLKAKSKVNSATFLTFPAETILLKTYKITKRAQPIATANLDALSFACKVEMTFGYFNPTAGVPAVTARGWNLVPPPGGGNPGSLAAAGWYSVKTPAAFGAQPLYQSFDMLRLLQYRDDTL